MQDAIKFKNIVKFTHINKYGDIVSEEEVTNLLTTAGRDYIIGLVGSAQAAPVKYLALTSNTTAPAASDTTLTGEYVDSGLARTLADYAHTAGTNAFTFSKTFTSTANSKTVAKAGLFTASVSGTLCFETALTTPKTLDNGDQLTVTWNITLG